MNSGLLTRIAKNSFVGLLEKLIEISTGIVSIGILARYLDIETFGLYTVITTFAGLMLILCSVGLDRVMVRDIAAHKENLLKYLQDIKGARIILAGINLALIIIIAFPLGLNNKITLGGLLLFAVSELISMYAAVYMSVFRAFEKMEYNTFITFLTKTITLFGLIAVAYFKLGFLAIFISMAIGNIFKAFLTIAVFRQYFSRAHIPLSFANARAIVKGSLIIAVSTFFAVASFRMGVYLLKAFGTLKDVAYFQASNVLFIQLQPLSVVIVAAIYPIISSRQHDSNLILENAAKLIFMLSLPITALAFFYGDDLIMLVYGHKYIDAIPAMRILIFSVVFTFLAHLFEIGLLTEHRQKLLTIAWGIAFFVNVILGAVIVPRYGLLGCAAVMSISYLALFLALYFFLSNYTMFKIKKSIFIKPGAAFIAMMFYLYFSASTGKPFNIKLDILNISVSLVLYMAVLFMLKALSGREVEFIKNSLLQKKLKA
jgi:O-antigen/teichoic acid export membrane protein